MTTTVEMQSAIDKSLGEPAITAEELELQDIAQQLKSGDLPMPDGFKIQVSDWSPLELRNGFSFGREVYGYYPSGWLTAAIAWKNANA